MVDFIQRFFVELWVAFWVGVMLLIFGLIAWSESGQPEVYYFMDEAGICFARVNRGNRSFNVVSCELVFRGSK